MAVRTVQGSWVAVEELLTHIMLESKLLKVGSTEEDIGEFL